MFGLPGDRFETHANVNYMDFIFKSNKDALMFAIEHNGSIVPDEDLTVEAVGRYMQ
jgi:sulfur carrier protein ThiS